MENNESIHVWCDWGSTAIWLAGEDGYLKNADYGLFALPEKLIIRLKYWESWFNNARPECSNEENKTDEKLYDAYGLSLAIELKQFVGEKHRVFYGHPTYENCVEIIFVRRELLGKEEESDTIPVPISVPYKK